ncbi:unnamed protein product [Chironomus riparius]|uniref:Uncharacterized protein n=1 Tax=Chironomus riparius TaxID=315576 RepID=A0A9N9WUX8_9DIPT|nr:unnamed protein product [Chironomus riparius]
MGKIQLFAVLFIIFQLTLAADLKCSVWMKGMNTMHKCCKLPLPIDEKIFETASKLNMSHCEKQEKVAEMLNLKNADKAAYKNHLTKVITDSDWKPILVKNSDFCVDLAPKLVAPFAKKVNITEEGCGAKFMLTFNCWMATAYSECPEKFYTDSSECKELTKTIKECKENTADIIKAFEAPQ